MRGFRFQTLARRYSDKWWCKFPFDVKDNRDFRLANTSSLAKLIIVMLAKLYDLVSAYRRKCA